MPRERLPKLDLEFVCCAEDHPAGRDSFRDLRLYPVVSMTENQATGVWSYTTPMPSGTYTYGFYVNCTSPAPGLWI